MENNDYTLNDLLKENDTLKEAVQAQRRVCDVFLEICEGMTAVSDTDKLTTFFMAKLPALFNVNRASFMFIDEKTGELFIKAAQGLSPAALGVRTRLGEGFGGRVAKEGKPLLVRDIEAEFPGLEKDRARYNTKSFIIVPVRIKESIIGVISLTDKNDLSAFNEADLKILNIISRHFALRIENIRLLQDNNSLLNLDSLTGLFSHRHLYDQIIEEIYRNERYHTPFSLLLLDIDNFSAYNRTEGYAAGDIVLKQLAGVIKKNTRKVDLVCRFGPEEFAVLLPETRIKEAVLTAQKLRLKINETAFAESRSSGFGISRITVSIGVSAYKTGLEKEELVDNCLKALLEAKQKGKDRVCSSGGGEWFIHLLRGNI